MLAIRLPDDIELRLSALVAETGRTKTTLTREAILEYIDDLEDFYLVEALARNNRKSIPLRGVEKPLDLAKLTRPRACRRPQENRRGCTRPNH